MGPNEHPDAKCEGLGIYIKTLSDIAFISFHKEKKRSFCVLF